MYLQRPENVVNSSKAQLIHSRYNNTTITSINHRHNSTTNSKSAKQISSSSSKPESSTNNSMGLINKNVHHLRKLGAVAASQSPSPQNQNEGCLAAWSRILSSGKFDTDQESLDFAEKEGSCPYSVGK